MIFAFIFTILFAVSGVVISEAVFTKHKFVNRIWLGLAIGLLMLTWLPSLFALFLGFTLAAQLLSAADAFILLLVFLWIVIRRNRTVKEHRYSIGKDWKALVWLVPILILCCALLHTHILYRHADGSLWVGQVTYGDLAMHLGFITGIAEQTTFPPQYSIFPGHALNYPFLCETSGASLYQLGASVRDAYLISAIYAFVLVILGVYRFFEQWLKRRPRTVFATLLFFFGSGFGFFYFLDLAKDGGILPKLIGEHQTVSQMLLDGFYLMPTNLPALGLRWVNPIVDMLIPQRATLFGWAFLFPCLYLLHGFAFEKKLYNVLPLAVFAGLLPMIHTHSFLALGIISAVYCVTDLIVTRFEKKRFLLWLAYALIACALAAPQLFLFTFRQANESSLVRFHLNWANNADSYLWFYIKNLGLIFLLMPFAFLLLPKRDRQIYAGAIAILLIAECIEFQPNDYDNNKLLFIWFAFTCALVSKFLFVLLHRVMHRIAKKTTAESRRNAYRIAICAFVVAFLCYFLFKLAVDAGTDAALLRIRPGTLLTVWFSAGVLLSLCISAFRNGFADRTDRVRFALPCLLSVWILVLLSVIWLKQYRNATYTLPKICAVITLIACTGILILFLLQRIRSLLSGSVKQPTAWQNVALSIASFVMLFTLFASSTMTILREVKSEYQVYTKSEAALAEQIKEATEPDSVILANSYHWNLITPLTGRSIVTGTGTFLYYHGIQTAEREADVTEMYENPAQNKDLFDKYNVRYVLISNAERGNYAIDYGFFEKNAEIVAQNESGVLYRLKP